MARAAMTSWFRQRDPTRVDAALGVALLVAIELQVWLGVAAGQRRSVAIAGVILSAAVALRRRWPFGALVVGVGAVVVQDAFGGALAQQAALTIPAGILLFYAAGAGLARGRSLVALGLGVAMLWTGVALTTRTGSDVFFDTFMIALLPWSLGRAVRARGARERLLRELAERADAESDRGESVAAVGERTRIAREVHDVIAHTVSVMVIQAGAARTVMDADPQRAADSLAYVERAGREALIEMRRLVGVFEPDGKPRPLAPHPGLAEVGDLVDRARGAGLDAQVRVEGEAASISPALDLCAYRIVQEGLTNAIKHAGPARVDVCVRWTAHALELHVVDDGLHPAADDAAGGHGIVGMRERAALHGGSVEAGPDPDGGFAVRAHLPLAPERVA